MKKVAMTALTKSGWQKTWLLTFITTLIICTTVAQASDLQIYAAPDSGKKTLIMMLDTSGSMGWGDGYSGTDTFSIEDDYNVCVSGRSSIASVWSSTNTAIPRYLRYYCTVSNSTASTNAKVTSPTKGCEAQPLGAVGTAITGYRCYDRLSRLKDGMFEFLNSPNSNLDGTRVGLGNFSAAGDGSSGQILVAAKELGATGSTQRELLKQKIAGLTAYNGTPSAHAYAEAAAYLMGTSTYSETNVYRDVAVEKYRLIRKYVSTYSSSTLRYNYSYTYTLSTCNAWNSTTFGSTNTQTCTTAGWGTGTSTTATSTGSLSGTAPLWTNQPTPTYSSTNPASVSNNPGNNVSQTIIYRDTESQLYSITPDPNSGIPKSKGNDTTSNPDIMVDRTASNTNAQYKSPLPDVADRATCDGQGIYFLSDGQANASSEAAATQVMKKALTPAFSSDFNCNSGLVGATDSAYSCIGAFAKKIFDPTKNPTNASIRTAFVGFGADMDDLSQAYVKNSCQLSSRAYPDAKTKSWPTDKCSPDVGLYPVAKPTVTSSTPNFRGYNFDGGYGTGGFFQAYKAEEITNSVIAFINDLDPGIVDPLTTGPISVPVDPLNPRGFQPYGYLRALAPDPKNPVIIWRGNLKKYNALLTGDNAGAFAAKNSSTLVYKADGTFNLNTQDIWNSSSTNDGGEIDKGGAYSQLPMPVVNSGELRKLFTDVSSATTTAITPQTAATSLLRIPEGPLPTATGTGSDQTISDYVLQKFNQSTGQAVLKDFPVSLKLKLLNYLGYNLNIDSTTLPTVLNAPANKYVAMGGSIHSFPVQLTYSGTFDANGNLTTTRKQSLLYGSMEGGLHVVDATTGVEQMVFVPSEILSDSTASRALVSGQSSVIPVAGIDGTWISDPAYKSNMVSNGSSTVQARQMNIYGGLRMGGNSYYGLDILDPTSPKLLFRINNSTPGYERIGQSWSKPVLANIRYKGEITRVMIVGGGYDTCYEDPRFVLAASGDGSTCAKTTAAKGNSVYIVNAKTGELIWSASNTTNSRGVSAVNANMKHSIVSRISTLDRNADGLIDHLYFADLGGQVFRADLNNESQRATTNPNALNVRLVRLANLATKADGTAITNGDNPRFYEPVMVTIHDQGANTFILVSLASGDRSTPLDVFPVDVRTGISPSVALTARPVNNVYGIIDRDFIKGDLISGSPTLLTENKTLLNLRKDPQTISTGSLVVSEFFPSTGAGKDGWYRSLSSTTSSTGSVIERANGSFRKPGGLKAFEEPMALTGTLLVSVYDPEGTGVEPKDPCKTRVIGETDRQQYCLPYGVCLDQTGAKDMTQEVKTGFKTKTTNCPAGVSECNDNIVGEGIRGLSLAPISSSSSTASGTNCGGITLSGNQKGSGAWTCTSKLLPTRWYEKYIKAS